MKIKKILTTIITIILALNTSIFILNLSLNKLISTEYIKEKVYQIDIVDTINSSKDNNMIKVKNDLAILYTITDILKIDDSKVDSIINSKISKDTLLEITLNIIETIKSGKEIDIITTDEYKKIVDKNIDYINENLNLNLDSKGKLLLKETLYKVGDKVIHDIPKTGSITSNIPTVPYYILHILLSDTTRLICIIFEIVLITILILMLKNIINTIRSIFNSIVCSYFVLTLVTGYLMTVNNQSKIFLAIISDYVDKIGSILHILFYISLAYVIIRRRDIFNQKKSK